MRYKFLRFSLILVIAITAVAQRRADEGVPSVERLRAHVSYLASDKLEGRKTGSPGADMAAEYVAREFSRYGLRRSIGRDLPGMSILETESPRRYMQEFPFVAGVELGHNNSMVFKPLAASLDLRLGEDWMPLGLSTSGRVENAPFAFFGYGITASDLNYNDYKGTAASGAVAIIFAGTPDGDNPHGQFARYSDLHIKAAAARAAGARALVVIATEENFKDDKLSRLRYDNEGGDAGLPVVAVSRQAGARILNLDLSRLEEELLNNINPKPVNPKPEAASGDQIGNPIDVIALLSFPSKGVTLSIATDIARRTTPAYNIVGILDGSDPVLKNEAIVIGAHYDHLGRGGEGSLATREGDIHHGADDNASGVAGMLELARLFSANRATLKRTLVFIAFSGEEEGLLGSNFYVNHPVVPLDKTVAMINMDMIGRMKEDKLIIGGVGTAQQWRDSINFINNPRFHISRGRSPQPSPTIFSLTLNEDGYGPSDHSSFYAK